MKAGDYVIVNEGVWDTTMPEDRRDGIVLEMIGSKKSHGLKRPDQAMVLFSNGAMLKFHKSQLTVVKSKEQFYL
tara:strand:- start:95 stop:316 length:222 start_codon:yes stop_codon:yes gene_type:complete